MSGSNVRAPGLVVLADGYPLPNVQAVDVFDNAHFAATRFRLRAAVPAATAASLVSATTVLDVQLTLGGTPTSVVQGGADCLSIDPLRNTVEIEGRDLTARLLEARTQETFANQTASEIAATLAARHGLQADVTATTTLAGRYYEAEHDRLTLGQFARSTTEWDLLTFLAAREGFDVFVAGQTLTFTPSPTAAPTLTLSPADCITMRLDHVLTLARDLEVTVKSWNTRQQSAFSQTARSAVRSGQRSGPVQRITVVRPNLAPNDALLLAQRILGDLSAHERVVTADLPGELALTPRSRVQVTGTGTDFDQVYRVAELDRHLSVERGFFQRLRLKNTPPTT